ncbi:E3 ubiquitin-protein like [Actinidia chinensis var. chinensis]|uniref:E3 ubiquitin-protein ligase RMA n=1 Tax=Actinidia chinensis var. chinensis TaxID=1590841 RepID=A0A2R6P2P7_ACTCC|nr:E3 ubiquitin-protein like [Actinidia chinensis var. chinensis]
MGDEIPNAMNLDLNLGPSPSPDNELGSGSLSNESVNLEDWIDRQQYNRYREALRLRARQRLRSFLRPVSIPPETRNIALELMINSSNGGGGAGGGLQTGEGSVSSEGRNDEAIKTCENNVTHEGNDVLGKKEDEEKGNGEEGSFFDCNICLDLARNPVVTCCGHLFCWPCLYRWLHVHSDAKECPVCKGEVAIKNLTPIYGRGNSIHEPEEDPTLKIPSRPQARRIESWRQTIRRNAFTIPMEEMIRRLGSGFDLTRDLVQVQPQNTDSVRDSPERNNSLLNRILTSRGMRREQNTVIPQEDIVDVGLTPTSPTNSDVGESRRFSSLFRRSHAHRAATISNLTSALSSPERFVESYFHYHHAEINHEQPPPVDDRDSVSSIAAAIHSESQTVDTAVEIDSTVSLSTSSSRRRNDASRVSDVDSGESRAYRRRRLN